MAFILKGKQRTAAGSQTQHTLVLAGHGTGKTAVVADYAIRQAFRFKGRPDHSNDRKPCVLVLTHTINGRDRVRRRIEELEPDAGVRQLVSCMTFHGFALKIVNRYGHSKYQVDEDFDLHTVQEIISRKRFRNKIPAQYPQDIVEINESCVGRGTSVKRLLKNRYPHLVGKENVISQIIRRLEVAKEKEGKVSPNDLPRLFMELVRSGGISPTVFHKEFQAVAIDEFQDTLNAQWEMIKAIVGPKTRLFVAGDPGQCIFTWVT
jgi:DNA helicase II / ATP-dependent DNA helicase PcrA